MKFIPYGRQSIDSSDIKEVVEVLHSDYLTTGPVVEEFENKIAKYCGAKYAIAVSNGTAALHLSSLVLLNKGDRVLTTPNSFVATSNAIIYADAKPIFVDITRDGNIDLDICIDILKKDKKIKALYCVHFSGNPVDQDKLQYIKKKFNIKILEDCAHSIGATFKGIKAGSCKYSDISIFSFHPVKNMTTGEGGAVTTNSKKIYNKIKALRSHGIYKTDKMKPWEYELRELGFNYRLTDIQSALGISQLKKLDSFIQKRQELAKRYDKAFKNISYIKPLYSYTKNSAYHLYVVLIDFDMLKITRKELFIKMKKRDIGLQVHYIPINSQPYYKKLGYKDKSTPIMQNYYKKAVSLPIYPLLSSKEQDYVIQTLLELCR